MGDPFAPFCAVVVRAIDGDSIVVRRNASQEEERIRVGGVDVPSRGHDAEAGKRLIRGWTGRRVHVRPTATHRVHSEIPAIVVDDAGHNLGMELLAHGRRLHRFPIKSYKSARAGCLVAGLRMATLPDLGRLSLPRAPPAPTDATVFEHLVARQTGKTKGCNKHQPRMPDPSMDREAYDRAAEGNCAIDGYLMYKPVARDPFAAAPPKHSFLGRNLVVAMGDGSREVLFPLGRRSASTASRLNKFGFDHSDWVERVFEPVCARGNDAQGNDLGTVDWQAYKEELVDSTDWYHLDPDERGHLFLQLLDTPEFKEAKHMPTAGLFEGRYVYISLVCARAGTGFGKRLMEMAEAACRALGCTGIALATLSNSAEFYLSQGFQFMSREEGQPVDVTPWLENRVIGGKHRQKLNLTKDVDVPAEGHTELQRANAAFLRWGPFGTLY